MQDKFCSDKALITVGDSHDIGLWINAVVIPLNKSKPIAAVLTARTNIPTESERVLQIVPRSKCDEPYILYSIHKKLQKKCDKRTLCDGFGPVPPNWMLETRLKKYLTVSVIYRVKYLALTGGLIALGLNLIL